MRRVKTVLTVFLLLLVILGCILLPGAISQWNDKQNLGVVTVSGTDTLPQIKQNDLSVVEKLKLVGRFELQDGTVTVTLQKNAENAALTPVLLKETCKRELAKLRELEILPFWNPETEVYFHSYQVLTYIDVQNPENYVLLWEVSLSSENMNCNLVLDDKTGQIYQFYYWNSAAIDALPFHTVAERWGEYLGLQNEYPKYKYSEKENAVSDAAAVSSGMVLYRDENADDSSVESVLFRFEQNESSYQIYFLSEPADSMMCRSIL